MKVVGQMEIEPTAEPSRPAVEEKIQERTMPTPIGAAAWVTMRRQAVEAEQGARWISIENASPGNGMRNRTPRETTQP